MAVRESYASDFFSQVSTNGRVANPWAGRSLVKPEELGMLVVGGDSGAGGKSPQFTTHTTTYLVALLS
jgi:hypothetical protein